MPFLRASRTDEPPAPAAPTNNDKSCAHAVTLQAQQKITLANGGNPITVTVTQMTCSSCREPL